MKKKSRIIMVLLLLAAGALPLVAQQPDFDQMLRDLDQQTTFGDGDFSAVYTIISERPGEEREVTQARLFRRDQNDQFLILILQPEVQRGQGYLQVDKNVWFYDPESRKFERTTIRENIQGSDAQNADLDQSSYSEDYSVTSWEEGRLGSYDVYILDLEATNSGVAYDRVRLWVRKTESIVLKQEDYSVNGRLMRTSLYPRYERVGSKLMAKQVLIVDELNPGERTQLTMTEATTQQIPDSVFSKAYLERVNN
ncbi:MAG: outer membrane lipoprotein-sorting protein [Spirochaetales bacterium]|nr:MAG: outer membrane lipoprotein-sorting protein [Spirochaetales bacterium]